jgi:hypothetical protein
VSAGSAGRARGGPILSTGSQFRTLDDFDVVVVPSASRPTVSATDTKRPEKKRRADAKVVGAAKGVTKTLRAGAEAVVDDFILVLVGLLTLSSALLGAVVIYRSRQHLIR